MEENATLNFSPCAVCLKFMHHLTGVSGFVQCFSARQFFFPLSIVCVSKFDAVCAFLSRPDHPEHTVRLPHEDQAGVALLCSPTPPAGAAVRCVPLHTGHSQLLRHGAHGH